MPYTHARQQGFTLVEILVTIGIISLLVGLSLAGMQKVRENSRRQNTSSMLSKLAATLTEYEVQHKGKLRPPIDGDINTFITSVMRLGNDNPAERMLRNIDERYWAPTPYIYNPNAIGKNTSSTPADLVLIDDWGTPADLANSKEIEYFHGDGTNDDPDDSYTVPVGKLIDNQPARPKPYFGSAGPDGKWGTFTNNDFNQPDADAKDNLYSFQIGAKS